MAKVAGLSYDDMMTMSIGDVLDYCYIWADYQNREKSNVREATQEDIDKFF